MKGWLIEGKVQGVWFRESTRRQAEAIGDLRGFVRNLPSGQVEVQATGPSSSLDALEAWLSVGPELARVDRLIPLDRMGDLPQVGFEVQIDPV